MRIYRFSIEMMTQFLLSLEMAEKDSKRREKIEIPLEIASPTCGVHV